ncbi:MAG: hypothetical protein ACRDY5_06230 [Acidimicrobiales bacterium]
MLDVIVEPRFDTNFIPTAGSQLIQFFANPVGTGTSVWATASAKTIADTNMDLAGQLAAGYNFIILAFRLTPSFNCTIADATLALNGAAFIFTIGSKDYLRVPARTIPAGAGQFIGGAGATTTAGLGWPALANNFSIAKQPLELSQTQNFSARLVWPGGGQAVTTTMAGGTTVGAAGLPITCFLDGYLKRLPQ